MADDAGRTLDGRTVLVTRPADQAAELVGLLERRGARPLVAPAIRVIPADPSELDRTLARLVAGEFDWLVLTSRAGVDALFERARTGGIGPGELPVRVAAVGAGTAAALVPWGVAAEVVPETFTTEALGEAFPEGSGRVLLARADIAPEGLEASLAGKGWTTERVVAYRTQLADSMPGEARAALLQGRIDAVTFTSASTVRGFLRAAGGDGVPTLGGAGRPAVVCIGPVTAEEANSGGLVVDAVAVPHTIEGLVAALERVLGPPAGRGA
jgi:uroporphyrinogen-III synthase